MNDIKVNDNDDNKDQMDKAEQKPDPEVTATAKRRKFSAKKKIAILDEIDERKEGGLEIGSVLRREGLYSAQISWWRQAREEGTLKALQPKKRGRKPDPDAQLQKQLKMEQAENQRLRKELEQAQLIIDVQKKLSQLLGLDEKK